MAAKELKRFEPSQFPPAWPYTEAELRRMDESPDFNFYSAPRFVTHIDDAAIRSLTAYYADVLSEGDDVLDICSSWISHLPESIKFSRVAGLGMNARELEANKALSEFVAADLNTRPELPFDDASFDAVLCVVSVDYLCQPEAVFAEMHRVLRPGGQAIMSFSNRCFPSKAVSMWLNTDDTGRMRIVGSYFALSPPGGWADITALDISLPRQAPQAAPGGFDLGAILANLQGSLASGDPMYVVRATKKA